MDEDRWRRVEQRMSELAQAMERASLAEYIQALEHPRRLLWINFWLGAVRGLGAALGFTVLGAALIAVLRSRIAASLPVLGAWLADLIRLVRLELGP